MTTTEKTKLAIAALIDAPVEKVWSLWTDTNHIVKWSTPSPDWHTTKATHDLKTGGTFVYRMEAKDGSFGFDFGGTFDVVKPNEKLDYTLGDGRRSWITLTQKGNQTQFDQVFEAEAENPEEFQRQGWQSILNSFKNYAENN